MGNSMVTARYHYVEWRHWDHDTKTAGDVAAVELYDLVADPEENVNVAGRPDNAEITGDLARRLEGGWKSALLAR